MIKNNDIALSLKSADTENTSELKPKFLASFKYQTEHSNGNHHVILSGMTYDL